MVLVARRDERSVNDLDLWLLKAGVDAIPVDVDLVDFATQAWLVYGKGRHPAGLNFADCLSYALAKRSGEPLLFKGEDFSKTDIQAA
jgi:ribonuclease VapC